MAVVNDVKVRVRANIIVEQLNNEGNAPVRAGRIGNQGKYVLDIATLQMDDAEFKTRLSDAQKVIQYGYRVTAGNVPPIAETADATNVLATSATINGFAQSGGGSATTGFQWGTTRSLGTIAASTEGNTVGVVVTPTARSARLLGLTANTKYYYRFYVAEIGLALTQYGIVKSFTTPKV